ncbi:hypothetical protein [Erythrobacter rubeus]|uniref:Uncharacterized protein n=1 Tax=Erythrobacter rubeus TaxID=2760803 RepID=A0ABR8KYG2_9SPHN|nr:hypothetical protein [Erythrobacter rubeus]MBD2843267.1 hypothetical protein [Erythrobacter rubeus]
MFEKTDPIWRDIKGDDFDGEMLVGSHDAAVVRSGEALRAIEWSDLTAKLDAARDLRRVLRRDSRLNIAGGVASFGDAAATYFRSLEQGERAVNQDALEPCKSSEAIGRGSEEYAQEGDARDL